MVHQSADLEHPCRDPHETEGRQGVVESILLYLSGLLVVSCTFFSYVLLHSAEGHAVGMHGDGAARMSTQGFRWGPNPPSWCMFAEKATYWSMGAV